MTAPQIILDIEEEIQGTAESAKRELLTTAFQPIRPSKTLDSKMSSAMTRPSVRDTAKHQTTESSTLGMLEPDLTKVKTS